jgi:glycosyltransferase involved in cell wall biosynthesis/GT2 family glycosyltransferase
LGVDEMMTGLVGVRNPRQAEPAIRAIFDSAYYLRQYPDVAAAGRDPLTHFLGIGWAEGRNPCALFDTELYFEQNADVYEAGLNPLVHYVSFGAREGRKVSHLFDAEYYLDKNPDIADAARANPLLHYLTQGAAEGRSANALFDQAWYLERYPEAREGATCALAHFAEFGLSRRLSPHPDFDSAFYLDKYPDVGAAGMNPLVHYLLRGAVEARETRGGCHDTLQTPLNVQSIAAKQTETVSIQNKSLGRGPSFAQRWDKSSRIVQALASHDPTNGTPTPEIVVELAKHILAKAERTPTVSVIIPTWNRSSSICRAVRSALDQHYKPTQIIISDDGSTDSTVATILTTFADELRAGLILLLCNDHKGVSAARNAALAAATGDIITYLDSDNSWRPEYLLLVSAVIAENHEVCTTYAALKSHNLTSRETRYRATEFDRKRLLTGNFIDLNVFAHRRRLYDQCGGFDESLTRLVDWDLIVRYTYSYPPAYLRFCGVDYFLDQGALRNITFTENLEKNFARVARKNFQERIRLGVDSLRIAYFAYDFPALSQAFVINELRWLKHHGYDVKVFYAVAPDYPATLDFEIEAIRVSNADELAGALIRENRNICHSHFAYPGVTQFVAPACERADVSYTFMPHAVDIFHHNNRERSRLSEITNNERCLRVFVYGDHHRRFLESKGVRREKIAYTFQAVEIPPSKKASSSKPAEFKGDEFKGLVIARFIEKKGIEYLIEAAARLRDLPVQVTVYGYGPLAESYQARLKALGLRNFSFPGVIDDRQLVQAAYENADFLVAPCVEAENGDVDGFPTVILEAMAAGKPVITTNVSAIPDYLRDGIDALLATPRDANSLALAIRRLYEMSSEQRQTIVENAHKFLQEQVGVEKTMDRLLDTWCGYRLDVFLVTYNTPDHDDRTETFEIVRRLLSRTTTPYQLTIVDNGSDESFLRRLEQIIAGHHNVRLLELQDNKYCGPASNIALHYGDSEFAVYVCSKEGFVRPQGWDRSLLEAMRNVTYVMAGTKTHLPKYTLGKELVQHPKFDRFRNKDFAKNNPERPFQHIQGGAFILRRSALEKFGGFSDALPQDLTDVELSYFLESQGAELGDLPCIRSVSIKTRPNLPAVIDEHTVLAHPLNMANVLGALDGVGDKAARRCNLCSSGPLRVVFDDVSLRCLACQSTPLGRAVGVLLAHHYHSHRHAACLLAINDPGLIRFLSDLSFITTQTPSATTLIKSLLREEKKPAVLIVDLDQAADVTVSLRTIVDQMPPRGVVVAAGFGIPRGIAELTHTVCLNWKRPSSYLALDARPVVRIEKP